MYYLICNIQGIINNFGNNAPEKFNWYYRSLDVNKNAEHFVNELIVNKSINRYEHAPKNYLYTNLALYLFRIATQEKLIKDFLKYEIIIDFYVDLYDIEVVF